MNVIDALWRERAHSVMVSGYNTAISNYSSQKNKFLQQLQIQSGEVVTNFMEQLNREIDIETNDELDSTFNNAYNSIADLLELNFASMIEGNKADFDSLVERFADLVRRGELGEGEQGRVDPNRLYDNMQKSLENFLMKNDINRSGLANYVQTQTGLNTTNQDIQNNLFGYARRVLLNKLKEKYEQPDFQKYKTSLKGYYKEELMVPALKRVLSKYGIVAQQSGSMRNSKGQQIKYDIILGTSQLLSSSSDDLRHYVEVMEQLSKTVSSSSHVTEIDNAALGGIQSKSWIAPWSERSHGGNRYFLSFGHNSALMPQGTDAYYWHAGMYQVMSNLTEAIGVSNFIFSTGDTIYWTADLLTEFKERQYVLAFYYTKGNKKESPHMSSEIVASQDTD